MWPCYGKRPKIYLDKPKQPHQLTDAAVFLCIFFDAIRGVQCKLDFALTGLAHLKHYVLTSTEGAQSYREWQRHSQ